MKLPRAPDFWWKAHPPAGYALAPLGMVYGQVSGRLMRREGRMVEIPVLCVGNLVLGGAGKTPTALEVASVCRKLNLNPGFLTRGYGGRERGRSASPSASTRRPRSGTRRCSSRNSHRP